MRKTLYHYAYRRSPTRTRARRSTIRWSSWAPGPVGLTAAIDLALRGVPVVLLDDADRIGEGSRGICYAKRTLEILDRLGVGERLVAQGVTWKLGKVFLGDALAYSFDLLPEDGHKMPAFINLQQYYLEKALVDRVDEIGSDRSALEEQGRRHRSAQRRCAAHDRDAGRALPARRRLGDRRRRRALDGARPARPRLRGRHLRGKVPDRRRAHGGGFPDRAAVLVRPAVPLRPVGADAPAAGQCLAHRPAARPRCRRGRGTEAGAGAAAAASACSATATSSSNGYRSIASTAAASIVSSTAA